MAIYEYRCGSCGTEFEARRPMSEAGDPAPCPVCCQPAVISLARRVVWLNLAKAGQKGDVRLPVGLAFAAPARK